MNDAPEFDFWLDGCRRMGAAAVELLREAGLAVDIYAVMRVVESAPRDEAEVRDPEWFRESLCGRCLAALHAKVGDAGEGTWLEDLAEYFLVQVPRFSPACRRMLEASFSGVLRGVDLGQCWATGCPIDGPANERDGIHNPRSKR